MPPPSGPFSGFYQEDNGQFRDQSHVTVQRWREGGSALVKGAYRVADEDGVWVFESYRYPESSVPWAEAIAWARQTARQYELTPTIDDGLQRSRMSIPEAVALARATGEAEWAEIGADIFAQGKFEDLRNLLSAVRAPDLAGAVSLQGFSRRNAGY